MKISEYIDCLSQIMREHGDIEVDRFMPFGRGGANHPTVAYRMILNGRERTQRFWNEWDDEDRKGAKVVRI